MAKLEIVDGCPCCDPKGHSQESRYKVSFLVTVDYYAESDSEAISGAEMWAKIIRDASNQHYSDHIVSDTKMIENVEYTLLKDDKVFSKEIF